MIKRHFKRHGAVMLMGVIGIFPGLAEAADTPMTTEAALQTLLAGQATGGGAPREQRIQVRQAPSSVKPVPAQGAQGRLVIRVSPGQTLRVLIRQHFANSPFDEKFLQRVFVELNPDAFVSANPHRLRAGASLWLPTLDDLLAYVQPATVLQGAAARSELAPEATLDRKRWVRYP